MQRKAKNQKYLHLPIAFFLRFCYNDQVPAMWGISTVGRTSLQLFSPAGGSRRKAVSVRSAQNLTRKFGALAQLVEQAFRCSSPLLILHQKAVNVKSTQNLAGIFGAIAQLVERTNSNASPLLILYQKAVNVKSAQNLAGIFGAIAQLVEQAFSCLSPPVVPGEKQFLSDLHKI